MHKQMYSFNVSSRNGFNEIMFRDVLMIKGLNHTVLNYSTNRNVKLSLHLIVVGKLNFSYRD